MKRKFVGLCKLNTLWTDDADWQAHVASEGVGECYTLAETEEGGYELREFACDELDFTDERMYCFMGSEYERERFYEKDVQVYVCKADGTRWALDEEEVYEV